ncbi:MAG: glycine cleavage system protein H [Bdellovibrionales bacterium RIFCSPHIGHO2_01_FULL_40_29]|nr:MAG: glycine cleavage system protein H [Bdellovibrionales bacterium RIFCSPHIGHO2_01_FULL_40_29]OFZ35331.1 MAG: glycine cleavage system protein H [Bdellovibrionales bacterium RIFCSPHIGHO2_02_FULL_40_15]
MEIEIKNFAHHMWYQDEDGIITIGINEEGLADITEITSVDLPPENESVAEDVAIGTIETDDGPLDIYSPVAGKVVEVNTQVLEDPSLIQEDPYEEGWLVRIEASEEIVDDDDDDEDFDDEEDDDLDDDDEEEE